MNNITETGSTSSFMKIKNNNGIDIIVQWGTHVQTTSAGSPVDYTQTFPTSFSNTYYTVFLGNYCDTNIPYTSIYAGRVDTKRASDMRILTRGVNTGQMVNGIFWLAIGY